jgi:hypothetical protein
MCRSIPFVVALTAFSLSCVAATSCEFLAASVTQGVNGVYGIFRFGGVGGAGSFCSTYRHSITNDPALQASQAGAVLSCLLGATAVTLLFLSFFLERLLKKMMNRILLPVLLCGGGVFQTITFAAFGVEECNSSAVTCSLAGGANRALAAAILYFAIGVGIIFFPRRSVPLFTFSQSPDTADQMEKGDPEYNHGVAYSEKSMSIPPPPISGAIATSSQQAMRLDHPRGRGGKHRAPPPPPAPEQEPVAPSPMVHRTYPVPSNLSPTKPNPIVRRPSDGLQDSGSNMMLDESANTTTSSNYGEQGDQKDRGEQKKKKKKRRHHDRPSPAGDVEPPFPNPVVPSRPPQPTQDKDEDDDDWS